MNIPTLSTLLTVCFFSLMAVHSKAQRQLLKIPPEISSADSLAHYIYFKNNPDRQSDRYGIAYSRKFGWLKMSQKFNTDSFYLWTKQYCIDRVGEDYFNQHFRVDYHSIKDDPDSEVFQIKYYLLPFDTANIVYNEDTVAIVPIVFKCFNFLGMHEIATPQYLPDCRSNPGDCKGLLDKKEVLKIVAEKGLKSKKGYAPSLRFEPDYTWSVGINTDDWLFYHFSVDSRTGTVSEVKKSHRID